MKKFIVSAVLFIVATALVSAQHTKHLDRSIKQFESQKVESRIEYHAEIPTRMTKVVVAGDNSMSDLLFQNAVKKGWYISPYEFCSYEEFEKIKCDTNYYFLLRLDKSSRKNEDSYMEFITFLKGNQNVTDGVGEMTELISLPVHPKEDRSGRAFAYLPAYMNIIQSFLQKVAMGEANPLFRKDPVPLPIDTAKELLLTEEDFTFGITREYLDELFHGKARLVSQDEIDDALSGTFPDTIVSLIVGPEEYVKGAYCYKMLISTDTYELYFYRKHSLSKNRPSGFLKRDIRKVAIPYNK